MEDLKKQAFNKYGKDFATTKVEDVELITFQGKIYMPKALHPPVVVWYHEFLAHPEEKQTEETKCQWFHWTDRFTLRGTHFL
jgi:hypothetical protein